MFKKCELTICSAVFMVLASLVIVLCSCGGHGTDYSSPPGYNFNKPYVIKLPSELSEISGIAYYAKDNSIFAESDEKGGLYKIFLNKPTDIRKWKFGHKRNYEDIVLHDSTFYVLNNNGDIVALIFQGDSLASHEYTFPENGNYEFESLYYDDQIQKLVLLCKDCDIDKNGSASAYTFDLNQSTYSSAFTIDTKNASEANGPKDTKFKPSAASINPLTGDVYILSSANKLLAIAGRNGAVKEFYHLDPSTFGQPEGIAFAPNGNLFISNEGGKGDAATLLFYQYKKPDSK